MGKYDDLIGLVGRAYHGTPSPSVQRFDPGRIGSGAGTSQGHGYYFSGSRDLAQQYGSPMEVEIALPRDRLVDLYTPLRDQPDMLDRFAEAVRAAPENKWKNDAFTEMMRRDGEAQLAYQSLLRAHNVGEGGARLGRYEAGRRASQGLFDRGVLGGLWDGGLHDAGAKNYVIFPGSEDAIRVLRAGVD
jgi:hypothetical protein